MFLSTLNKNTSFLNKKHDMNSKQLESLTSSTCKEVGFVAQFILKELRFIRKLPLLLQSQLDLCNTYYLHANKLCERCAEFLLFYTQLSAQECPSCAFFFFFSFFCFLKERISMTSFSTSMILLLSSLTLFWL